jgi:hypothetical protein
MEDQRRMDVVDLRTDWFMTRDGHRASALLLLQLLVLQRQREAAMRLLRSGLLRTMIYCLADFASSPDLPVAESPISVALFGVWGLASGISMLCGGFDIT